MTKVKLNGEDVSVEMPKEEFEKVKELLNREPSITELGGFDVMWSEHCSYKSSRPKLKLFEDAEANYDYVLAGPGEDAGVIDIGDGYALAFRIESHNHPSAIEPYHGAATGIGGIIRDVLCMGVRPIALLDPLRFGRLAGNSHAQWLFKYVVKGIADYGNCTGIPTIGGEVEFDDSFENNCLVNVACIGLGTIEDFKHAPSRAYNPGDYIILMGGSTGRDGIHGVTFASRTLTEMSEADRPAVQIGDPFTKKMIIEATLEAVKTGYVRGLKDLGGGGLTCATSELTGDGNTGANIELRKVFTAEPGMTSYEIMLSESQERMAFIVKPEGLETVLNVFRKYEVAHAVIGKTDDSKVLKVFDGDELVVNIPAKALSVSPTFKRQEKRPDYLDQLLAQPTPEPSKQIEEIIEMLIASENICSKEWIYRQYDHEVGVRSVVKCGDGDSGVLRIIGTNKFIAASVGVNSKHCYLDPYEGAKGGLVEICGNVITTGAWYFSRAVDGMNDFCRTLKIPIVGGNVSFYNEDEVTKTAIKATPQIMIVGLIEGYENIITLPFKKAGNDILILGETKAELGGSEYHSVVYGLEGGIPPKVDEAQIKAKWDFLSKMYDKKLIKANHDISKGGFIITVAEMCFKNNLGADLDLSSYNENNLRDDELLFSETIGRFIIETEPTSLNDIMLLATEFKVKVTKLGGILNQPKILIKGLKNQDISLDTNKLKDLYDSTIPNLMDK